MSDTSAPIAAPPGDDVGRDNSQDRKSGFTPMPAERTGAKPERTAQEQEFSTGRQAADALAKRRRNQGHVAPEARPTGYWDAAGTKAPANETVTLNRAADDLKASRTTDAASKELTDRHQLALDVDNLRAKEGVPTQIDPTQIDPTQIDPRIFGDSAGYLETQPQQPQIEQHPAPPGVDPDLHQAFQNPKIRAAVEAEVTRANEREVAFGDGLRVAQNAAIASFAAHYPEFVGRTPQQIAQAFAEMQRQNPQRAAQAQASFAKAVQFESALAQNEARKQQAEQQQFQSYAREQDAAFNRRMGQRTPQQRQAMATELISYAGEFGVDQKTLVHLMQTSPVMRHHAFQSMIADAISYRLGQKNLAEMQRKQRAGHVPHVQQPGHSNVGRSTAQSANLQALANKFAASGNPKDGAAFLTAQRNARKR